VESARPATADDLPAIEDIAARHRKAIVGERGASIFLRREAGPSPIRSRIERALAAGDDGADALVVVGCYDHVVFGYGLVEYEELLDGALLARLTDFVVDGDIRGSGIGEAMMELIVQRAGEAGCIGIDSVALPGDRETKNFFESFGLKARLLTVHRSLVDPEGDAD